MTITTYEDYSSNMRIDYHHVKGYFLKYEDYIRRCEAKMDEVSLQFQEKAKGILQSRDQASEPEL